MDGGPRFCRKKKKKKTRSKLATVVQRNYTCHVNIHKRRIRQTVRTMPSLRYLAYTCGKNCHFIEPRVPAVFKRNSARGKMRFVALTFFLSFFFGRDSENSKKFSRETMITRIISLSLSFRFYFYYIRTRNFYNNAFIAVSRSTYAQRCTSNSVVAVLKSCPAGR